MCTFDVTHFILYPDSKNWLKKVCIVLEAFTLDTSSEGRNLITAKRIFSS